MAERMQRMTRVRIVGFLATNLGRASTFPDEPCPAGILPFMGKPFKAAFRRRPYFAPMILEWPMTAAGAQGPLQIRQKRCLRQLRHSACTEQVIARPM